MIRLPPAKGQNYKKPQEAPIYPSFLNAILPDFKLTTPQSSDINCYYLSFKMPTSIYDSFQKKLLDLELASQKVPNNYRDFSSDTLSTVRAEAPYYWISKDHGSLTKLAKTARDLVKGELQDPLPLLEETHYLQTESDVLRASSLYLFHPVNVAATSLLKAKGIQGGKLECGSERTTTQRNRTDIKWVFKADSGKQVTIAVLELKNTKIIHQKDFAPALIAEATSVEDSGEETCLEDNAVWLAKQSKKYSDNLETPDVAVFDWDAMFVFDFNGPEKRIAYGTWFSESDQKGHPDPNFTFRSVLLGFLVQAMVRQKVIESI